MYHYTVLNNELLTPTIRLLTLTPSKDAPRPLLHQPGQYAAISLRDKLRPTVARCFSIISSPSQQQVIQFSMRVGGRFTSAIQRLKKGDSVSVRGPFGGFVFNEKEHNDLVMFAGGIGVAPFMSMIRYATDRRTNNKLHLIFSCRDQSDIPFYEELDKLRKDNPNLKITYIISSGPMDVVSGDKVMSGKVDESNIDHLGLRFASQTYMICGPAKYMEAVHTLLSKRKVARKRILTEAFSQGAYRQTDERVSWPFNVYALSTLAVMMFIFLVAATDLNKTLPKLTDASLQDISSGTGGNIIRKGGNLNDRINSLSPQIDTNISSGQVLITSSSSQTVTQPKPTTIAPTPTPTPTVVPVTRPRTRVS